MTWTDVKTTLADFDRAQLLGVIADLYSASRDNQTFLHARFTDGESVLQPYKDAISRWVYPNVYGRGPVTVSVAKAKKAISDYRRAVGKPEGLVELMTFYCEQASAFCADVGMDDEGFFNALVVTFEQALKNVGKLNAVDRAAIVARLEAVRSRCHGFGYCVGDTMDELWGRWGASLT